MYIHLPLACRLSVPFACLLSVPFACLLVTLLAPDVRAGAPLQATAVRLNEVLYDALGADQGQEFVELVLTGTAPVCLATLILERGNGSREDDWRPVWSGTDRDTLLPGDLFVIGGAAVVPLPDAVVELGLQNGPDACRLCAGQLIIDRLGWGEHTYAEYAEGDPAPAVPAGTSLGRVPDGVDTEQNARDWQPLLAPSPGARNRAIPPFLITSPGHHSTGHGRFALDLAWRMTAGSTALPASAELVVIDGQTGQQLTGPITVRPAEIAADGAADGVVRVPSLPPGVRELGLVVWAAGTSDTFRLSARIGPGALRLTEVMARPRAPAPEWIEVINAGEEPLPLAGWTLADARLMPVPLVGDGSPTELRLEPGEVAVIAEAPFACPAPLSSPDRWPILNDGGDRVRLIDPAGRTSDDLVYGGSWAPAGASLTRLGLELPSEEMATWLPEVEGTPGRFDAPRGATAGGFLSIERPERAGGTLLLRLAAPLRSGALRIYRLDGRRVRSLEGAGLTGRTEWAWNRRGDDGVRLPPGLYLIQLEGNRWDDGRPVTARTSAVVTDW